MVPLSTGPDDIKLKPVSDGFLEVLESAPTAVCKSSRQSQMQLAAEKPDMAPEDAGHVARQLGEDDYKCRKVN